jgi:hypothetical protein
MTVPGGRSASWGSAGGARTWWPTGRDLGAMVGLPERLDGRFPEPGAGVDRGSPRGGTAVSPTVVAALLTNLFK